jgi:hypothetical protein
MWWLALIVYGLILAGGTWVIAHRTSAVEQALQAKRDMPFNHRIGPDDVTSAFWYAESLAPKGDAKASFAGRYTTGIVRAGQVIRATELAAVPILAPDRNKAALLVRVDRKAVSNGQVNAHVAVMVCAGAAEVAKSIMVSAVICPPAPDAACVAAIEAPPKDLETALANAKGITLTAQVEPCK